MYNFRFHKVKVLSWAFTGNKSVHSIPDNFPPIIWKISLDIYTIDLHMVVYTRPRDLYAWAFQVKRALHTRCNFLLVP